jgi:rieske iron-sulfur protein
MSKPGPGATTDRLPDGCGCDRSSRRDVLTIISLLGLEAVAATARALAEPASERPKEGDMLVSVDSDTPTPLEPKDIVLGGPQIFAWPMDPAATVVRKGSRLNKVLLVRLDPATLVGATGERAAAGVVAYSAICPHAGCEVGGWDAEQKILECSCHYSHFNPREGATVVDGPATHGLPALPLKVVDGKLVVAKPFTGRVGIVPS